MSQSNDETVRLGKAVRYSGIAVVLIAVLAAIVIAFFNRMPETDLPEEQRVAMPTLVETEIQPPEFVFTDVTATSGIDFVHTNGAQGDRFLPETMGGGIAVFDFDLDGDEDLLFVNSREWGDSSAPAKSVKSLLYENDGSGNFKDVTQTHLSVSVYGLGPAVADINGDLYPDLFIAALGENKLFLNDHGKRFVDVTEQYGVGGTSDAFSTCATFFDYDLDGDLDLFVCNYVAWSEEIDHQINFTLTGVGRAYGPPTDFPGANSWLYRNDRDKFTDVSSEAGLDVLNVQSGQPEGKALAVAIADFNGDQAPDILIANDTVRNFLYINQTDGTFVESGIPYGLAFDPSGAATGAMGLDVARFGNDERLGIAIGNFANEMTSFYVGEPEYRTYSDDAIVVGIGASTRKVLTFGLFFLDADLDGRLDLLSVNGHIEPEISNVQASQQYEQSPQLFWNCGQSCQRDYILVESISDDFLKPSVARGAAYTDFDSDGDLDLVITNVGGIPKVLRNDTKLQANWLDVKLQYKDHNRHGIGALVSVNTSAGVQRQLLTRTKSYLTQVVASARFGLGSDTQVREITVEWPDGTQEKFVNSVVNRQVLLKVGEGQIP